MFPSVSPFFQRTPTTVRVLGFQAGRTVGVTHAVLHFYFGDLNKRKRMQISFYIPGARSKLEGCDISRSVRRRFQQLRWRDLLLWSSGQAHCLVGGLTKRAVLKCWKGTIKYIWTEHSGAVAIPKSGYGYWTRFYVLCKLEQKCN